MRSPSVALAWASLLVAVAPAWADHEAGCAPESADPATVNTITTPDGRTFYIEERDNPVGTQPPVPGSGFLLGGGTWIYEEANELVALQRGGAALGSSECTIFPPPGPCILIDQDPINDESCGHGPDALVF